MNANSDRIRSGGATVDLRATVYSLLPLKGLRRRKVGSDDKKAHTREQSLRIRLENYLYLDKLQSAFRRRRNRHKLDAQTAQIHAAA